MLLLSDCEINACPKGRVKRNVVFNMDLTLSRWSTTVQVNVFDGTVFDLLHRTKESLNTKNHILWVCHIISPIFLHKFAIFIPNQWATAKFASISPTPTIPYKSS